MAIRGYLSPSGNENLPAPTTNQYTELAEYDPVLRAHCRLADGGPAIQQATPVPSDLPPAK